MVNRVGPEIVVLLVRWGNPEHRDHQEIMVRMELKALRDLRYLILSSSCIFKKVMLGRPVFLMEN